MPDEAARDGSVVWRRIEDVLIILCIGGLWAWFMEWEGPAATTVRVLTVVVLVVIAGKRIWRLRRLRDGS